MFDAKRFPKFTKLLGMRCMGRLVLTGVLWLVALPSEARVLVPSRLSPGVVTESYEVDRRFEPRMHFDQENTPTCFAFSAAFLLQYLYNSQNLDSTGANLNLSAVDVLAKGSYFDLPHQGLSYVILAHLKDKKIRVDGNLTMKELWAWRETLPLLRRTHEETRSQRVSQYLKENLQATEINLPPYNLHVFDPSSQDLQLWSNHFSESQEEVLIASLKKWFQKQSSLAVPLSVSYCEDSPDSHDQCSSLHTVSIVGVRTQCSSPLQCRESWRIRGSWGGASEGWFQAKPLAEAILKAHYPISFVTPCSEGNCRPSILGIGDSTESSFLATHPLHYLAFAREEDAFFKVISDWRDPEVLKIEVIKKIENSKSLGHMAVLGQSVKVAQWLALNYPEVLKENGDTFGNSAHLAASLGHLDLVETLIDSLPELFQLEEQRGFRPADFAGVESDWDMLHFFQKKAPKLLKMKNKIGLTPLELLRNRDFSAYKRFKKSISLWGRLFGRKKSF